MKERFYLDVSLVLQIGAQLLNQGKQDGVADLAVVEELRGLKGRANHQDQIQVACAESLGKEKIGLLISHFCQLSSGQEYRIHGVHVVFLVQQLRDLVQSSLGFRGERCWGIMSEKVAAGIGDGMVDAGKYG